MALLTTLLYSTSLTTPKISGVDGLCSWMQIPTRQWSPEQVQAQVGCRELGRLCGFIGWQGL